MIRRRTEARGHGEKPIVPLRLCARNWEWEWERGMRIVRSLPNMGNIVPGDIRVDSNEGHLVLEVLKGRVKIIRYAELPFCTAKSSLFLRFFFLHRSKSNKRRASRYFLGHLNDKPVVGGDFDGLRDGHGERIA